MSVSGSRAKTRGSNSTGKEALDYTIALEGFSFCGILEDHVRTYLFEVNNKFSFTCTIVRFANLLLLILVNSILI
jgi:hypothetical protein